MTARLAFAFLIGAAGYAADPSASGASGNEAMRQSLAAQRASLSAQTTALHLQSSAQAGLPNPSFAPIPPTCESIPAIQLQALIASAARRHSLPAALIRAVIKQESGFRPCAISVRGALGLMQLMPTTAQEFHAYDPFDPKQNVEAGASYLRYLLGRYNGDLRLALAAYNSGPGRVDETGDLPNLDETVNYVGHILLDLAASHTPGRF